DLVSTLFKGNYDFKKDVIGGSEETTTGVIRLRAMEKDGVLLYPIISGNDALAKRFFDTRYGARQSTLADDLAETNLVLTGQRVVIACEGWCGRGVASRAKGMGGIVIVTEIDPLKAIEAAMDGFEVMTMDQAAPIGDVFITLTGNTSVLRAEHFKKMKDGAIM